MNNKNQFTYNPSYSQAFQLFLPPNFYHQKDLTKFEHFPNRLEPCNSKNAGRIQELQDEINKGNGQKQLNESPEDATTVEEELRRIEKEIEMYCCRLSLYVDIDSFEYSLKMKQISVSKLEDFLIKLHGITSTRLMVVSSNLNLAKKLFTTSNRLKKSSNDRKIPINKDSYQSFIKMFKSRHNLMKFLIRSARFTNGVILSNDAQFFAVSRINFAPFDVQKFEFDNLDSLTSTMQICNQNNGILKYEDQVHILLNFKIYEAAMFPAVSDKVEILEYLNKKFKKYVTRAASSSSTNSSGLSKRTKEMLEYFLKEAYNEDNHSQTSMKIMNETLTNSEHEFNLKLLKSKKKRSSKKGFFSRAVNYINYFIDKFFELELAESFVNFLEEGMFSGESIEIFEIYGPENSDVESGSEC